LRAPKFAGQFPQARIQEKEMKRILAVLAVAAAAAFATPTWAGSASAPAFKVTATVADNCTITATDMTFATSYDPVVANITAGTNDLTATSSVTVACTVGKAPSIGLSGTPGARQLSDGQPGDPKLSYELYQDSGFATAWGNTVGTDVLNVVAAPSTAPRTYTVHGKVPGGQPGVKAGTYTDSVTATVNF
jgi:spore coat protein U-like protein